MKAPAWFVVSVGILAACSRVASAEAPRSAQASEVSWNELTAQYTLLYRQHHYADAMRFAQQALTVAEQAFGAADPRLAQTLNDLGHLYQLQDQPAQAEPYHRRALAIREHAAPADDAGVTQSVSNLAKAYQAQGRYAEAEPLWKRAQGILEAHLGPSHLRLADVLNELAEGYRLQGRMLEAEPLFKRAMEIIEAQVPPLASLATATMFDHYAACLRTLQKTSEAEAIEAKAVQLRAALHQTESPPKP